MMILLDILSLYTGLFVSYLLNSHHFMTEVQRNTVTYPFEKYFWVFIFVIPIWIFLLHIQGIYNSFRTRRLRTIYWKLLKVGIFMVFVLAFCLFFLSHNAINIYFNKFFVFFFAAISLLILMLQKTVLMLVLKFIHRHGLNKRSILVVGTGERAKKYMQLIKKHGEWGLSIAGLVDDDPDMVGKEINGYRIKGILKDIPRLLDEEAVNEVVFVVPRTWLTKVEESILECELRGVKTSVAVDIFNLHFARPVLSDFDGFPVIQFETTIEDMLQLFVKRLIDIFVSALMLLALLPLFLLMAVLIKATSKGPVFFRQIRSGLNGRKFTMYKFRTMEMDAERKREVLAAHNELDGPAFKMKDDPRLTGVGRYMRKLSLDEFPQLINVLNGEMSLVGPRPLPVCEAAQCQPWQRRRTSMKPGMTCIWQVSGRNNISFNRWIEMDLEYIDNWSLKLDLKLLLETIPAIFKGHGAY
jgi:exopolysaccharide biosynthesis polyprenyl glycosylphosphotransferase